MMKSALAASTAAPAFVLFGTESRADSLTPLDASEPSAKALSFVYEAATIDVHVNPTYKAGQRCGLCAHYRGRPTDLRAGCEVFTSHSVPASGWCLVWGARSSCARLSSPIVGLWFFTTAVSTLTPSQERLEISSGEREGMRKSGCARLVHRPPKRS